MSLRLLLDENAESEALISILRARGHDVVGIRELGFKAASDLEVLDIAIKENRVLYTRDRGFYLWALERPKRPGIIVEHQSTKSTKNMSYRDIANALEHLSQPGSQLRRKVIAINNFRTKLIEHRR